NDVSPEVLAEEARSVARDHDLWIDVIEPDRARELGMGMFLAVGKGSDNPPRMIVLRSGGEGERDALDRHLAIVGKGVCFDSGGISIKPADRMEEMKMDKIGACTVIAAIGTVGRRSRRRALLADPAPRRLRPRHGQLVRRHPELRRRRGLADQERVVPAGVPDGAVGPPRHRRLGLFPQDDRLGPAWGDGRDPRDARRAGAGGGEGLSPLIVGLAVGVAIFGALADRLAVRWPEHDEEHPAGRAVGRRTGATAAIGAFGFADVKLLVGVGLMTGLTRTVAGLLAGLLAAGLVLAALLATRRIGRRTYVPFGPFLIFGALWSIFVNG